MTHGKEDDVLQAKDKPYKLDEMICKKLTADKCPSLAGKPKLFFVQACKGRKSDSGAPVLSTDSPASAFDGTRNIEYTIPNEADFFIAYATAPGMKKNFVFIALVT
jgi:caspase 7